MRMHGGRWADYWDEHGRLPLDFSSNTSPLGIPASARAAATVALEHADRYPDPNCRALRRALARTHNLDEKDILVGNGAGDLIDRLALALRPRRALVTAPTFSEYRIAFERAGCTVEAYRLLESNDFALDNGILDRITPALDVLVLCEPNNPTGRTTNPALLDLIVERCDATGTLLALDECFVDFLDEPQAHSLLRTLPLHSVLVLRAFTSSTAWPASGSVGAPVQTTTCCASWQRQVSRGLSRAWHRRQVSQLSPRRTTPPAYERSSRKNASASPPH